MSAPTRAGKPARLHPRQSHVGGENIIRKGRHQPWDARQRWPNTALAGCREWGRWSCVSNTLMDYGEGNGGAARSLYPGAIRRRDAVRGASEQGTKEAIPAHFRPSVQRSDGSVGEKSKKLACFTVSPGLHLRQTPLPTHRRPSSPYSASLRNLELCIIS